MFKSDVVSIGKRLTLFDFLAIFDPFLVSYTPSKFWGPSANSKTSLILRRLRFRTAAERQTIPSRGLSFVEKTPGVGSPPRPRIGDPRRENLHVARPWDPLDRRHTKLSGWRRSTRRLLGDRRLSVFATRPGVFCDLGRLKLTSECVFLLRAGHLPHHGDDQNAADRWVDPRVQVARPRHFALHRRTNGGAVAKARATSASRVCRPSVVTACVAKHLRLRCWVAWAAPAAHVFARRVSSLQSHSL